MAEAAREIELKFAVPADRAEAVWREVAPQAGPGKTLISTYFDTADRRLSKAGFALRIRDDGKRKVQTLKGPDPQGFARAEYEADIAGPGLDLDLLAETPAAAVLDGAPLEPLFTVEVTRRKAIIAQGAAQVEICLDLGWVEGGGRREAISEIELELKSGTPAALFAVARRLTQKKRPLTLAFESKAERGFRLLEGARREPSPVKPGMDAAAAFTAIGEAALAQIAEAAAGLEAQITPKGVHELRVGLRRLRSARPAFKTMLADKESVAMFGELKWLAGALDEMRDLDVLALSKADADAAFHAVLETARAQARVRLAAALDSPRRRALALKVAAWLTIGAWRRSRLRVQRLRRERPIAEAAAEALAKRLGKLDAKLDLAELAPPDRKSVV